MKNNENKEIRGDSSILKKIRAAKKIEQISIYLDSDNLAAIVEVIRHETLGPLIHERYCEDRRSAVRYEIACEKSATKMVLLKLENDKNQLVRTTARLRLAELDVEKEELT